MSNAPTSVVRVATGIAQGEPASVAVSPSGQVRAQLGDCICQNLSGFHNTTSVVLAFPAE